MLGGRVGEVGGARREAELLGYRPGFTIYDGDDQVRLVRVYQGETGPHNSVARSEFHYVIDRVAGIVRYA